MGNTGAHYSDALRVGPLVHLNAAYLDPRARPDVTVHTVQLFPFSRTPRCVWLLLRARVHPQKGRKVSGTMKNRSSWQRETQCRPGVIWCPRQELIRRYCTAVSFTVFIHSHRNCMYVFKVFILLSKKYHTK